MTRTLRALQSTNSATAPPPDSAVSVESDFVVILAALLCALISMVGLTAIVRCAWLRRGPVAAAGSSPTVGVANRGLKKKVLNSLPKFTYLDDGSPDKWVATSECAICLSEFAAGEEVRLLPQCGHGFHLSCIDTWLGSHSSCPSCRAPFAVARCQKCGLYQPTPTGASSGDVSGETESKSVGGDNAHVAINVNCIGNGVDRHSHSHNVYNGFLP